MITARLRKGHGVIQRDIMTMPEVSIFAKAVYCLLVSYAGERDTCYPSIVTIGENLQVSKPTILKAIKELENNQLVIITKVKSSNGYRNNVYEPLFLLQETSVKEIDLGSKGGLPSSVNDVDPKNNNIKNNIEEDLNINEEVGTSSIISNKLELKKEESAHHRIIKKFFEEMHPDFVFQPVHAKSVSLLKNNIKALFKKKNRETDEKSVGDFAIKLLDELPAFFLDKDLAAINSKFNEIISQLTNQNNGNNNTARRESKYAPKR